MDITPIAARLSIIVDNVRKLKSLQTLTYDEFAGDVIIQDAVERQLQIAIQAAIDVGSMILAAESTQIPTTYKEIFAQMADIGVIPSDFSQKLMKMAGFRNVLVHLYTVIDTERVYQYMQSDLGDFELFVKYVGQYLADYTE